MLLGEKGPKGPAGPKGPKRKKKPSANPKKTVGKTRAKTKETLRGKGSPKPKEDGTKKPPAKQPEVNTKKGFGCFMNQIKNNPILHKQIAYLTFAIKVIEIFLKEDSNPAALEVMGIDREQVVAVLQRVLGEYNDDFKRDTTVERVGDFLRNAGNPAKFLFNDIFQLTEDHDEGAIAATLNEFDRLNSQIPFFQILNAMLDKYKEVLKAIAEKNVRGSKEREVIARNILGVYRGNSPKCNLV